ncbi:MAG: extracellular solute-binding protein [Alphaproteobacteria bacterium]|nr:extracellular solute-binding protein [Alphaproteobacteria bacterium]
MAKPTLSGMTWDHPRGYRCLEAASDLYAAQTGVTINWSRRSLQAFADAPIGELAEAYDLIILDHPHVGLIAESKCLAPLPIPKNGAAGSLGGSLESYVWQDQLWAYPVDAACQVAVKRSDICRAVPADWEAVLDARPGDFQIVTPLMPVDAVDMMMTLVAGRGEDTLPISTTEFMSRENGTLALRILKALYRLGPEEAVRWNPITVLEAMATTDEFAYSPCLFSYINYARPGFRTHRLDYVDLPTFRGSTVKRGILGGAGIGVSALSEQRQEAMNFASWVASEPVQSGVYLDNDGQPAHPRTWTKEQENPLYRGFLKGSRGTMDQAWTRPRDVWFLGFIDEVCAILPDFFVRDLDEDDFLDSLNSLYRHHSKRGDAQ